MTQELLEAMADYAQEMVLEDLLKNMQEVDIETLDLDQECNDLDPEKWGAKIIAHVEYLDFVTQ